MSIYRYTQPPEEPADLPAYLREQLKQIETAINRPLKFTSDQFLNSEATINRALKLEGRTVWDETSKKPVWASGDGPEEPWIFGDGTVAYTPVPPVTTP
ncbi:hypothetical protein PVS_20 [Vibrio phage vB_VspS_VS-ABTNL-3]|nr:hypothetical protein PVS_20 [Vibrio phage vB_VspS_VS-ABTNL-3]